MIERLLKDTILTGIIIGFLSILLDYVLLYAINQLILKTTSVDLLKTPRIQLLILAANILLFRFMMLKWQRAEAGKGLLLALIIATVMYMVITKTNLLQNY